jgi:hypothetical protein
LDAVNDHLSSIRLNRTKRRSVIIQQTEDGEQLSAAPIVNESRLGCWPGSVQLAFGAIWSVRRFLRRQVASRPHYRRLRSSSLREKSLHAPELVRQRGDIPLGRGLLVVLQGKHESAARRDLAVFNLADVIPC